jgi:hypothetical protein
LDGVCSRRFPGAHPKCRRRPIALTETRRSMPMPLIGPVVRGLQLLAKRLGTCKPARNVVANMNDGPWLRLGSEEVIERDDAPGFGRRHGQATADVVERAAADPPDSVLNGMEREEQQIATILHVAQSAPRNSRLEAGLTYTTNPSRVRWTEEPIDGAALLAGRLSPDDVQIHGRS